MQCVAPIANIKSLVVVPALFDQKGVCEVAVIGELLVQATIVIKQLRIISLHTGRQRCINQIQQILARRLEIAAMDDDKTATGCSAFVGVTTHLC